VFTESRHCGLGSEIDDLGTKRRIEEPDRLKRDEGADSRRYEEVGCGAVYEQCLRMDRDGGDDGEIDAEVNDVIQADRGVARRHNTG